MQVSERAKTVIRYPLVSRVGCIECERAADALPSAFPADPAIYAVSKTSLMTMKHK